MESTKAKLKRLFFELKDELNMLRDTDECLDKRAISIATTELETAQLWAVRSLFSESEIRDH